MIKVPFRTRVGPMNRRGNDATTTRKRHNNDAETTQQRRGNDATAARHSVHQELESSLT
jgi:hypothetical protein